MRIRRFEELDAWREARILVIMVYDVVNSSNRLKKDYRLCSQVTDVAVSTMSNIAEGFSRGSNKEFIQFLFISKSSGSEVQSVFYVVLDQKYVDQETFNKVYNQADKVAQITSGMIRYLRNNTITQ